MVENIETSRSYSIALDRCRFKDARLSQLEIEYKWIRRPLNLNKNETLEHIFSDIENIKELILASNVGFGFVPTQLTKWEWLLDLLAGKRK